MRKRSFLDSNAYLSETCVRFEEIGEVQNTQFGFKTTAALQELTKFQLKFQFRLYRTLKKKRSVVAAALTLWRSRITTGLVRGWVSPNN